MLWWATPVYLWCPCSYQLLPCSALQHLSFSSIHRQETQVPFIHLGIKLSLGLELRVGLYLRLGLELRVGFGVALAAP